MSFNPNETGARIRELRLKQGITQNVLAEILYISESHMKRLESGKSAGSIDLYLEITEYFDVSLDYLLRGSEHQSTATRLVLSDVIAKLTQLSSDI